MNILITGSLGHIGSNLLNNLEKIDKLKSVYLLDNMRSNNVNILFNLKLKKNISVKFIKADLLDPQKLNKIKKKIDIVIHLASITNAAESFSIKKILFKNNYGIFKNIVKFCIKNNSKLIHLSSTSVYGLQSNLVDETSKNLAPQSPYAEEKILEENFLKKNSKKINYVTLRLGTITGISKGMRFHTAVNKFCFNTIIREDIPIWGKAFNLYRPYLSLKDAIRTIIFFINKKNFNNETYNVVTKNYTVKEILNLIKKNNYKIKTKIIKSPILNQQSFKVSRKKILSLGLKLSDSIENDIKSTLNLLKKLY
jgi:UDP-glucose 4-epimerase